MPYKGLPPNFQEREVGRCIKTTTLSNDINFKIIIRDPTDQGKMRKRPTPYKDSIKKNIKILLEQWNDVEYEGTKLVLQCALDEIDKLLMHVRKYCLSHIPPTGGTSKNEGIQTLE